MTFGIKEIFPALEKKSYFLALKMFKIKLILTYFKSILFIYLKLI